MTVYRILRKLKDGTIEDTQTEYEPEEFANIVPCVGDKFIDPGVLQGLNRREYQNREVFEIVDRYFMVKDKRNYIALVVKVRPASHEERELI